MNIIQPAAPQTSVARFWKVSIVLLMIALVAFWPTYFALGLGASSVYIHLHAATAALWMMMLAVQPWLVKNYRFDAHKAIGNASYVLAPLVVVCMLLLANYRIRTIAEEAYALQTYVLYLQFSLAFLFAFSYVLAIVYRREAEVHGRFMLSTSVTLIDPIFARLLFWIHPESVQYHQWVTFGLTDLALVALIISERNNTKAKWVFRLMLPLLVVAQIPALLQWTDWPAWQSFSAWFRSIPMT